MPFLELQDLRVHFQFPRQPNQPVLLLSNSLGTNLEMWAPQIATWSQSFSILRYDARGHGQSSRSSEPYTIPQLGTDVLHLMDALELGRVHFCGLSLGGMIGQWLGIHAPDRIEKLVLCNTAAKIGSDTTWNQRIEAVRRDGMQGIVPSVIDRWFTSGFRTENPREVDATAAMLAFAIPEGYAATCAAIRDFDLRESVQLIQSPTLIVFGEQDKVTPPSAAHFLHEKIIGSRLLALQAAHLSNIESASSFTAGVLAFLNDQVLQGASHER